MSFNLKDTNKWVLVAAIIGVYFTVRETGALLFFQEGHSIISQVREDFKKGDEKFLAAHDRLFNEAEKMSRQMREERDRFDRERMQRDRDFEKMHNDYMKNHDESWERFNQHFEAAKAAVDESVKQFDKEFNAAGTRLMERKKNSVNQLQPTGATDAVTDRASAGRSH